MSINEKAKNALREVRFLRRQDSIEHNLLLRVLPHWKDIGQDEPVHGNRPRLVSTAIKRRKNHKNSKQNRSSNNPENITRT